MSKNFVDGSMYNTHFGDTVGVEINNEHYSIVFNIKNNEELVFCIPLTSPKPKHFKSKEAYEKKDYLQLKYPHTYYIAQTNSIALIDQLKVISKNRLGKIYVDEQTGRRVYLKPEELDLIKIKIEKFIKSVLHKK